MDPGEEPVPSAQLNSLQTAPGTDECERWETKGTLPTGGRQVGKTASWVWW